MYVKYNMYVYSLFFRWKISSPFNPLVFFPSTSRNFSTSQFSAISPTQNLLGLFSFVVYTPPLTPPPLKKGDSNENSARTMYCGIITKEKAREF